jgi:hypothetical protein
VRDRSGLQTVNLEEFVRMLNCQAEKQNMGRDARAEVSVENALESEEDVGVLRLLLFQAALKERRILESKG